MREKKHKFYETTSMLVPHMHRNSTTVRMSLLSTEDAVTLVTLLASQCYIVTVNPNYTVHMRCNCADVEYLLSFFVVIVDTGNCFLLCQFAADFTEKTLFKLVMVRLLKSALDGTEEDLATMLSEEILNVDDQLLEIEKDTHEVSGKSLWISGFFKLLLRL